MDYRTEKRILTNIKKNMENIKVFALDWEKIEVGTMLHMKDFPRIKLQKLDNRKACYIKDNGETLLVNIGEFESELHGSYYYFKTCEDDWHPLTSRLWSL